MVSVDLALLFVKFVTSFVLNLVNPANAPVVDGGWVNTDYFGLSEAYNVTISQNLGPVPVGISLTKNQSIVFEVDLADVNLSEREALLKGVIDTTASHVDNTFRSGLALNGKLRREADRQAEVGHLRVVLKFGERALTNAGSWIMTAFFSEEYLRFKSCIDNCKKCGEHEDLVPIGWPWEYSKGYVFAESCAKKGHKCTTKTSEQAILNGLAWADSVIVDHPADTYKVGLTNQGAWALCVRYARKQKGDTYDECRNRAHSMDCPEGFCDGKSFSFHDHDEL